MGMFKSITKRLNWLRHVRFDRRTGFYTYQRFGKTIYIRHPRHFLDQKSNEWVCRQLIYNQYQPVDGDVVVDLGAGYGEEAMYLSQFCQPGMYLGVEAQPIIYECLANTVHKAGSGFVASPYLISESEFVRFVSQFSYASVGEVPDSYIEVPVISWQQFLTHYRIDRIDLFKMNIEGAEKDVLAQIDDFSFIKRFVISCHDFRADNGEGEWYRSKEYVTNRLASEGYRIHYFKYGISWADDWIYAERV